MNESEHKRNVLVHPAPPKDHDDHALRHASKGQGPAFHSHKGKTLQPISKDLKLPPHARPQTPSPFHSQAATHSRNHEENAAKSQGEAAIELIRRKVAALYNEEPDVEEELQATAVSPIVSSKHQQFMQLLSASGKPLAQVQTEWHNYYLSLPDNEKHAVWREFYQAQAHVRDGATNHTPAPQTLAHRALHPTERPTHEQHQEMHAAAMQSYPPRMPHLESHRLKPQTHSSSTPSVVVREHTPSSTLQYRHSHRTGPQIKEQLLSKISVSAERQVKAKQHIQSLVFGLGTGLLVLAVFLFGFFNEMFIAPLIQPSRHVSATPIILSADSIAASDTPEVIIPKINVQIPLVYGEQSTAEADVQTALERGVIHYPTTALPGQQGNAAFFGHSSNNIFNKGKYKFAFVLLHELVPGDVFYLTRDKVVYSYRVFDKKVVPPTQISVLDVVPGKPATAVLITCDPPGTSTNRLVVWGEQISPSPAGAAASPLPATDPNATPVELPSEGPTLWSRFWSWL